MPRRYDPHIAGRDTLARSWCKHEKRGLAASCAECRSIALRLLGMEEVSDD